MQTKTLITVILCFSTAIFAYGYSHKKVVDTLYNECEGEPFDGKVACMNVIQNRARDEGCNYEKTVTRGKWGRFSGACKPGRAALWGAKDTYAYNDCEKVVTLAERNKLPDITDGAMFFENVKAFGHPSWFYRGINHMTIEIGNHRFYRAPRPGEQEYRMK